MGGAGRSGDGLRMFSRVSVGGAGRSREWLAELVSRVCVYVDWRGWEVWGWVVNMVSRICVGWAGLCRVCL